MILRLYLAFRILNNLRRLKLLEVGTFGELTGRNELIGLLTKVWIPTGR